MQAQSRRYLQASPPSVADADRATKSRGHKTGWAWTGERGVVVVKVGSLEPLEVEVAEECGHFGSHATTCLPYHVAHVTCCKRVTVISKSKHFDTHRTAAVAHPTFISNENKTWLSERACVAPRRTSPSARQACAVFRVKLVVHVPLLFPFR